MAAKKKKNGSSRTPAPSPPQSFQFQTLIDAIHSPEGLKAPIMKPLYLFLFYLSSNRPMSEVGLDIEFNHNGVNLKSRDILDVFDILFQQLDTSFKQFFSALNDVFGEDFSYSDMWALVEQLSLLLRCCMLSLNLVGYFNLDLLIEKSRVLYLILRRLISIELSGGNEKDSFSFKKAVSRESTYVYDNCTTSIAEEFVASVSFLEPSDPRCMFVRAVLEVVADELLMHKSLREYFMLIDSASPTSEKLFMCHISDDDIGCVLEVISAHFILSVSDGQGFENFLDRLFWKHGEDLGVLEMSLPASLSLLLNPIILSAPKMFQAYLILLVSEVIGINMSSENTRPDLTLMDCYLSAFERSIILYTRLMSNLHIDGNLTGSNGSSVKACMLESSCQLAFESYLQPATRNKICHLVTKSDKSWDAYTSNTSFRTKSDLVAASISYTKESLNVFDKSCEDEILSILSCIIVRGSSDDVSDTVLLKKEDTSTQDIYLLASILKLMSSSMLQAMLCIRHSRNSDCQKSLCDVSSCKAYDVIIGIVGCFRQFDVRLPIQKFLFDIMETHPMRHKESKWMLLHFSGLLSLSYSSGLDFLVKDCIFTMMTLLNLFLIEEGNLDVLGPLLGSRSVSSSKYSDKIGEALVSRKSSKTIASKFQKIRTLYTSMGSLTSFHSRAQGNQASASESASAVGIEEEIEETTNGEIFLKCVGAQRSSDFDDLADFIECKPGKDYSDWLKARQIYRQRKQGKMAVLRWKKKRNTWKYIKGKKS